MPERLFVTIFGVKGVASLHYVAVALADGLLEPDHAITVFWTIAMTVMVSILVHGVSATAVTRRLLGR